MVFSSEPMTKMTDTGLQKKGTQSRQRQPSRKRRKGADDVPSPDTRKKPHSQGVKSRDYIDLTAVDAEAEKTCIDLTADDEEIQEAPSSATSPTKRINTKRRTKQTSDKDTV
jgi:hypothetical protein